jgi:hypothetical protein
LGVNINTIRKDTAVLLEARRQVGSEAEMGRLNIWLCLATKIEDKIIYCLQTIPLKMGQSSYIWGGQ